MLIQSVYDQISVRALKDPTFRKALIKSPRDVLSRDYKITVPPNVKINIVEDSAATMTLALPAAITTPTPEINDDELKVAADTSTDQVIITWTAICSSDGPCKQG